MATTGYIYATGTPSTTGTTWTNVTNATGSSDTSVATWTSTTSGASGSITPSGYGLQTVIGSTPASVDSVAVIVYGYVSNNIRITSMTVQLTASGTPIGSAQNVAAPVPNTAGSTRTVTFTGVASWSDLANLGVLVTFTRAATTSSATGNVDAVGVNVTYTPATTSPVSVTAPVTAVTADVLNPTVTAGRTVSVAAAVAAVTAAMLVPTVSVGTGVTVAAPSLAITSAVPAPSVSAAVSVTAPIMAVTTQVPAPTVVTASGITAIAPTLSVTTAVPAPVVSAATGVAVSAPVVAVSIAVPAPTVSMVPLTSPVSISAPVLSLSLAVPVPDVTTVDVTVLDPWTSGLSGEALVVLDGQPGVLEVTYPAEEAPAAVVEVPLAWQSHETAVIGGDTSGMVSVPLGVPHVWVDGVDVTYFRDVPTRIGNPRQESPFTWTGTTLTFPQVFHNEERGTGDLAWMRPDAPVEVAIILGDMVGGVFVPNGERLHRFTGQLTSDDPGVGQGRTECVWGVEGILWQSDHANHPIPARRDPTDIGTLIPDELNGTPSRRFATVAHVTTGIASRKRGSQGQSRWQFSADLFATAQTDSGSQWTLDATGPRSFAMVEKDTTTVHWTITAGAPGVELDLSNDHHERIDAVYGSGIGPDGYAWRNIFFPDLLPYDPPDYPYADPDQNVLLGDVDADTLTGTGISDWQRRIGDLGYKGLPVDGVMGSEDIAAVRWIQKVRGIQVDGYLGPQTWAATWNVGTVGGDLTTVRLPLAYRTEVEKYLYGANGATVGLNPDYDPSIIRHDVDIDFGAGVTKAQGRELAQKILERGSDPGITGTVRLMTCPWEGSRWEIDAGDNVLLKGYRGDDVLMRVVAVDPDFDGLSVTLTVDSEFRDAMAVVQILERNRESKPDPARRPGNPSRRSRLDQDQVTPFEGESPAGRFPRMAIFEGLWTVWPVPVSEVGIVAKLRFTTTGPASKFAMSVWGRDITANQIAAKVPNPLAVSNPWEDAGDDWLEDHAFIDHWGELDQAAGYGMLGSESEGSPVTGTLIDDAGFPYVSAIPPWVWVAVWSPVSCYIEGRFYPDPVQ